MYPLTPSQLFIAVAVALDVAWLRGVAVQLGQRFNRQGRNVRAGRNPPRHKRAHCKLPCHFGVPAAGCFNADLYDCADDGPNGAEDDESSEERRHRCPERCRRNGQRIRVGCHPFGQDEIVQHLDGMRASPKHNARMQAGKNDNLGPRSVFDTCIWVCKEEQEQGNCNRPALSEGRRNRPGIQRVPVLLERQNSQRTDDEAADNVQHEVDTEVEPVERRRGVMSSQKVESRVSINWVVELAR